MTTILLRSWLSMVLSFMSTFSPSHTDKKDTPQSQPVIVIAQVPHKAHKLKSVAAKPAIETAPLMATSRLYTYTFAGQATREGQPCSYASVEIQITAENVSKVKTTTTDSNGRYLVSIPVTGQPNETMSWEIHALSSDLKKAELEGHQILLGNPSIQMDAPLMLVES